eukprot:4669752-Amphidinium_carterae.2
MEPEHAALLFKVYRACARDVSNTAMVHHVAVGSVDFVWVWVFAPGHKSTLCKVADVLQCPTLRNACVEEVVHE